MELKDIKYKLPEKLYNSLEQREIKKLRPPQKLSIDNGLLVGKNLIVASPTASGKTLVAEIACVKNVLEKGGKSIYLTPLKALAREKYNELKKSYPFLKIMLSIGDYDSSDPWLEKADIIICSNEKLDSLIRHSVPWLRDVNTIVVDEIHLLDQPDRGPTLEILITRLKEFCSEAQIVALSATIKNAKELAEWLDANLVKSDYRPVELEYGICFDNKIFFEKKEKKLSDEERPEHQVLKDTLKIKKQILVFLSSRRNAESVAKNARSITGKFLTPEEKKELEILSRQVLNALESPTKQCKNLSECVKYGTAFHHAGLVSKQHNLIENAFKKGIIKLISATPTLAFGLNLPSHTVLVRDLKRYSPEYGSDWIPVIEVHQMFGRAGRPEFDREGRALTVAKTEAEKDEIYERYIIGEPEEIYSKLSAEPVLRMQTLGLIASRETPDKKSLFNFFKKTFFAYQYEDMGKIKNILKRIIDELRDFDFVTISGEKLNPTKIGKRVAELYIDPLSANFLIEKISKGKTGDIFWLHSICSCTEMFPLLRIYGNQFKELQELFFEFSEQLEEPNPWDVDYDNWIRAFKTSLMLLDWINEKTDSEILQEYRETPGILRRRLFISDWLLYSASELARIKKQKETISTLRKLRLRIKHGVGKELLNLIQLKGIGRVRARKLYDAGIKKISDVKKTNTKVLEKIIGSKTARKLKEQTTKETTSEQKTL